MKKVLTIFVVLAQSLPWPQLRALAQQKKAEPAKKAEFKYTDPWGS